jgi:curved DNA-binding protein CbpA
MSAIAIRAYKVLQVDREASPEVIEAAYRRLAKMYHPDVASGREATLRMAEINAAHDALKDPASRRAIDQELARATPNRPAATSTVAPAPRQQPRSRADAKPGFASSAADYHFDWIGTLREDRHAQRAIAIITFLVFVISPLFDRFSEPFLDRFRTGMMAWALILIVQLIFDANHWNLTPLGQTLRLAARLFTTIAKETAGRVRRAFRIRSRSHPASR